ncbi:hypothetical protein H5P28_00315 [Ruficoccus amylovorans]|uniref:Uncharacterized protein n=1 Tax=Ruficoccus amylovorans TaxID=1804625 RepID=A0A842H8Z5_9BACT|nr:hypothetical protein [Ruficoccus amylovorans]MBC2592695.1 hypothetical protein [Ruficoccus amylovorans]
MLEVTIPSIDTWPPLLRITRGVTEPSVKRVMGRAIANLIRRHLRKLDRERPNQLGGQRTHFYANAAAAVQNPRLHGSTGVAVGINHVGIAQRFHGGVIVPKFADWLSIPARTEAYGTRAREHANLAFILIRARTTAKGDPLAMLQEPGGGVLFWLVKRVVQQPDPSVLPTEDGLLGAALEAGEEYVGLLLERAAL